MWYIWEIRKPYFLEIEWNPIGRIFVMTDKYQGDREVLRQLYEDFLVYGLTGKLEECVELVEEPYSGIGLGEQGLVRDKAHFKQLCYANLKASEGMKVEIDIQDYKLTFLTEDSATICSKVVVGMTPPDGDTMYSGILQAIAARRKNSTWVIGYTHASPMMLSKQGIESYPFQFADHTLAQLKAELQTDTLELINSNFSGGIFGCYNQTGFPLYFANDRFIEIMGYERGEFEEKFKESTLSFTYYEEKEKMNKVNATIGTITNDFFLRTRFLRKDGSIIWVETQTRRTKDEKGNEVLITIATEITDIINLQKQTEEQHNMILESMVYASKIQRNLLPSEEEFKKAFFDYSIIWEPKDIVGGDIYWLHNFEKGTVLCVCDCTGHGIPGALLTMLVSSSFQSSVTENNFDNPSNILWELEKRLVVALNVGYNSTKKQGEKKSIIDFQDGCDLAVLSIGVDGTVKLAAGNMSVFLCDGKDVYQYKGQKLRIGDGSLTSAEEIKVTTIEANPNHKFYIATDGLYDQFSLEGKKFGYQTFKKIILEKHEESGASIADAIWQAFEENRGAQCRVDDVTFLTFKP